MELSNPRFHPLRGNVLIRRETPEDNDGGIIIPERYRMYSWRGTVISCGYAVEGFKRGEVILYLRDATVLPFADRTLAMTEAKRILAKLKVKKHVEIIMPQNNYVMILENDVKPSEGGIILPDTAKKQSLSGKVFRVNSDTACASVNVGMQVWFNDAGVTVVEDGVTYKLIDESEILCVQTD